MHNFFHATIMKITEVTITLVQSLLLEVSLHLPRFRLFCLFEIKNPKTILFGMNVAIFGIRIVRKYRKLKM